jgi:integrase/recombinase XerD
MDWSEGMLTINGAKFGKSRLVPLHASTCRVLADYVKRRDQRFGARSEGPFLLNKNGNRLDKGEVHRSFYSLSRQIGLRAVDASSGPRLHDFRQRADSPIMPNVSQGIRLRAVWRRVPWWADRLKSA